MASDSQLRDWIDRAAICDLIYRYSDAVNRADIAQYESVFAADALLESPSLGLRYEGCESIRAFLEPMSTYDVLIQTPHAPVVTLTGEDAARAVTTIHEVVRGTATMEGAKTPRGTEINLEQYGTYYDTFGRIDGAWKFTHRLFVATYVRSGCVTGDVLTARTAFAGPD